MTKEEAIKILDALAEGCSPFTGEMLEDHFILNERQVIRALQKAIDSLSTSDNESPEKDRNAVERIKIENEKIIEALKFLKEEGIYVTSSKLTRFFLGSRTLNSETIRQNNLFGMLRHDHTYNSLKPLITHFFKENPGLLSPSPSKENKLWASIDYFQQKIFCNLSEKAVNQLKEKVTSIPLVKTAHDELPEYVVDSRKEYSRAYEPWSEKELELLSKALLYTNDLNVLSGCFQRGLGSISSCGKRLIYEGKTEITPTTKERPV